jgi:tetratricopeptide (TPR) repeat protein
LGAIDAGLSESFPVSDEPKQWWQTLPAMIAGLATLVTALTGLLVALNQLGKQTEKKPAAPLNVAGESVAAATPAKTLKNAEREQRPSGAAAPSVTATVAEERSRDHESAVAYHKSGIAKFQRGDVGGAIADYDRAIELDPKFVDAYNDRASAREIKGDLTGALADYRRAIEINPNSSLAYFHRACIHYELRDFTAAAHDFRHTGEINPQADPAHLCLWLAEMHLAQKKRADRQLADHFGDRIKAPGQDRPARIAAFLLGQLRLAQFLPRESPSDRTNAGARLDGLFFAGMKCLFNGDKKGAEKYLRSSIEIDRAGPYVRLAKAELKDLR